MQTDRPHAEHAVVLGAVQQSVQLVKDSAGRMPGQEGVFTRQVANQLQRNVLGEEPRPKRETERETDRQTERERDREKDRKSERER